MISVYSGFVLKLCSKYVKMIKSLNEVEKHQTDEPHLMLYHLFLPVFRGYIPIQIFQHLCSYLEGKTEQVDKTARILVVV